VGITLSQLKTILIQDCTSFVNKNCLFFDEAHALKSDVRQFMKCMMDLNGSNKSVVICDSKGTEFTLELSCYNFMCIFATNQALADSAYKGSSGRLTELKLLPYSLEDRVSIFASLWEVYAPEMALPTKEAVLTYCRNVRPFARAMKKQIQDCRSQAIANGLEIGNVEGSRKALKASQYFPGGWTLQHVEVLQYLATTATGRQVQEVAAAPLQGATSKEAQEVLDELRQADFVLNTAQGRKGATSAGVAYLQSLTVKKTVKVTKD
jgi:Holliday junction resolvasome RuvABC ATP-dependent DNA helicase subunit